MLNNLARHVSHGSYRAVIRPQSTMPQAQITPQQYKVNQNQCQKIKYVFDFFIFKSYLKGNSLSESMKGRKKNFSKGLAISYKEPILVTQGHNLWPTSNGYGIPTINAIWIYSLVL